MSKYEFKREPWEHQRLALQISWDKPFFAYLMEYGTGKTFVVINNVALLFEKGLIDALLIIAPNEVHDRWVSEQIPLHLPDRYKYIARVWTGENTKKFKQSLEDFWDKKNENLLKIFSVNVEALQSSERARNFCKNFIKAFLTYATVDESTRIKTPGAKRTRFIVNNISKKAAYRRILTGNEITRSPFDVYSPYQFLKNTFWHPIPNFHVFKHRYGVWKKNYKHVKSVKVDWNCSDCKKNISSISLKNLSSNIFPCCPECGYVFKENELPKKAKKLVESGAKFEYPTLLEYKNIEELRDKTNTCSIVIRKKDCMDLPEKIYTPLYTQLNEEQTRLYQELKTTLMMEYQGEIISVINKLAMTVRFQQIVGGFFPETKEQIGETNPKIERLLYDLEDIDSDSPIIIWAVFVPELKAIYTRLRREYDGGMTLYYGETPKKERKDIINNFQDGKYKFFIANPTTGGTGLNLQKSHMHYYFSNSYKAEDRWQSEDRSHRGGQRNPCTYKDILIKGTVDDSLMASIAEKKNFAEFFKEKDFFSKII